MAAVGVPVSMAATAAATTTTAAQKMPQRYKSRIALPVGPCKSLLSRHSILHVSCLSQNC